MVKTVQAMKRIDHIRTRREKAFIQNRIKEAKKKNKGWLERELMKNSALISDPQLKSEIEGKKMKIIEQSEEEHRLVQLRKQLLGNAKKQNPKDLAATVEDQGEDMIDENDL